MKALVLKGKQFVTDAKGKPVGVLLDLKTYERLHEARFKLSGCVFLHAERACLPDEPLFLDSINEPANGFLSDRIPQRFAQPGRQ